MRKWVRRSGFLAGGGRWGGGKEEGRRKGEGRRKEDSGILGWFDDIAANTQIVG